MSLKSTRALTCVGLALAASAPAAEHADIIIKNAHVLTIDASANVYEAGVVAIEGDSIAAVGGTDLLGQYEADTVIDAHGLPAQRVLRTALGLHPGGLGPALLRELAQLAQVATPQGRALASSAPTGRHRENPYATATGAASRHSAHATQRPASPPSADAGRPRPSVCCSNDHGQRWSLQLCFGYASAPLERVRHEYSASFPRTPPRGILPNLVSQKTVHLPNTYCAG